LDKVTYDIAVDQGESMAAVNAGKLNFSPKQEAAIPKLVAPAGSAAAALAPPAAIAEPTKRAEKSKEAPPKAQSGLSSMVDDWGTDK
jgi:hypothetical protein